MSCSKSEVLLILIGILTISFVTVPVTGEGTSDRQVDLSFHQQGSFPDAISGFDNGHTNPHPYLVSRMKEKLESIHTDILDGELTQNDEIVYSARFPPNYRPGLRSTGDNNLLVILVDFPDAVHGPNQTRDEVIAGFNGPGTPGSFPPHDSVKGFYERSSYHQLNLTADVYGWYRASHERHYYAQMTNTSGRQELAKECLNASDPEIDFSRYDNDHDGDIDNLYLIWAGSDFNQFWWGNYIGNISTGEWDGRILDSIIWEPYSWQGSAGAFSPSTTNHETGHLLGLPDYYEYDPSVGPCGGLGGFDLMDAGMVDHNCFSKYLLGWIDPPVILEGAHDISLGYSSEFPDAVILMPQGSDGSYSEFFMVQARNPASGNDNCSVSWWNGQGNPEWTSPGLVIWHIDASLNEEGDFRYDNSFTPHKMVRLMEADGLEELENSCETGNNWDPGDLYYPGQLFGPDTIPNSSTYDGSTTGIRIDQITQQGSGMRMRITIPSSNPPPVSIQCITNLSNITFATDFITWTWTDPTDPDFDHVMVYLNGTFQANIPKESQHFSATGLLPDTCYTISTKTADLAGNSTPSWVNHTAWTKPVPLIADFIASPLTGPAPLQVEFTDLSTGRPATYHWDFGDGRNSSDQNPLHSYATEGIYSITLTVENGGRSDSVLKTRYITIECPIKALPGLEKMPRDLDGDGRYEDLDGNGRAEGNDLALFTRYFPWIQRNEPISAFDFNRDGMLDFMDFSGLS